MFPESSMLCHHFIFEPSGVQISTKTDSKTRNMKIKNELKWEEFYEISFFPLQPVIQGQTVIITFLYQSLLMI